MSIKRNRVIAQVMDNADRYIGLPYDRDRRMELWPGPDGGGDCSSVTGAIWSGAGLPLLGASGDELRTSRYQVNAVGFDLVYPDSRSKVGKLPSPKGLLTSYGAQAGDIVFWGFDKEATHSNKITHVGSIYRDGKSIFHTANKKYNCRIERIAYGDEKVCAIIRLRGDFRYPPLTDIRKPTESSARADEWMVRMLQIALNLHEGTKLKADGIFSSKTEAGVIAVNARIGKPGKVCTAATWDALGFPNNGEPSEQLPQPMPDDWPITLRITSPYMRPDGLALVQDGLGRLGYDCGAADGICGAKTMAGVQAFVRAHGKEG